MRSRLARLVLPHVLMLATAACASGASAPVPDVQDAQGTDAAMAASAEGASTTAVPSSATSTSRPPATETVPPNPTSANAVPPKPFSAVSRGTFWEVSCDAGTVTLLWLDKTDIEDGYRVYRNGEVIADMPADNTNYLDKITAGMAEVQYEIRAYNEFGESEGLKTAKLSC